MPDKKVSLEAAMRAQQILRSTLALPEETFSLPAFIGMVSDEIEQMRAAGRPDAETAAILLTRPASPSPPRIYIVTTLRLSGARVSSWQGS
jgi:hypothetical protein